MRRPRPLPGPRPRASMTSVACKRRRSLRASPASLSLRASRRNRRAAGAPGYGALLPREFQREFAVGDALGQAGGELGGGVLAVSVDELAQRREQAGLRHAVAVDAVE